MRFFVLIFYVYLPYNQLNIQVMKENLLDHFSSLKDTRINRRKLHPLINIIAMTIIAVMGDNNT